MIPPWLIEKIEKQEREQDGDRTPLHIPAPQPVRPTDGPLVEQDRQERGVAEVSFTL